MKFVLNFETLRRGRNIASSFNYNNTTHLSMKCVKRSAFDWDINVPQIDRDSPANRIQMTSIQCSRRCVMLNEHRTDEQSTLITVFDKPNLRSAFLFTLNKSTDNS